MKKFLFWLLAGLLILAPTCRAQETQGAPAAAAENEEGMPLGNQKDGDVMAFPNTARQSVHAPTPLQRNFKKSAESLKLAENGKALTPIVIAGKASSETKKSAQELAEFLGRITGATFEIQTPNGTVVDYSPQAATNAAGRMAAAKAAAAREEANRVLPPEALPQNGIVIGTAQEFAAPADLGAALEVGNNVNGREAYAIRTTARRVLVLSVEARGIHHAAYRVLHEIGCRWFYPGENWEIIPDIKNLNFGFDITDRPTIATRAIAFMDGSFSDEGTPLAQSRETRAKAAWQRRSSLGGSLQSDTAHAWHRVAEQNRELLLAHPEYFAEVGGVRQIPYLRDKEGNLILDKDGKPQFGNNFLSVKFELANPEVRKLFVNYALDFFKRNPNADMVSVDPTDGGGHSQSEASKKLGSVSNAVFGMANEVARAVQKEFPGKMVGVLAYNHHIAPPDFSLEDNIYIEITAGFNQSKYSYAQLYVMWPQKAKNIGFYEYLSVFDWDLSGLPGGRAANIPWLCERIKTYAGMNAARVFGQSTNAWGANGRGYYLASRLMWNPDVDADALLEDFYLKAYGPATPAMKRFHERIAPGGKGELMGANFIGQALRDLQDASTQAQGRPDVLKRIADYKQYMRYIYLKYEESNAPDKVAGRAKFVEMMQQLYAMRYSYMTHWAGASYRLGKQVAAKYNDVTLINSWSRKHPKFGKLTGDPDAPNIWDAPEPTPEKIEADFQAALQRYPLVETNDVTFDMSDLVPVEFSPITEALRASIQPTRLDYNQTVPRYIFYSFAGEPIEVAVAAGQIKKNARDATWTLRKKDESVVESGTIALNSVKNALSIKVPAAGMYFFDLNTNNNGGSLEYSTTKPASVVWAQGSMSAKGFKGAFFYVPKGTSEISYYYNTAGSTPHSFMQPDGKIAARLSGAGAIAKIPVAPGMDGKLWILAPNSPLRSQWFYNLPNIAAGSPQSLLIPRALAMKDGLRIRKE